MVIKGQHKGCLCDGTILCYNRGGGYMNLHKWKTKQNGGI